MKHTENSHGKFSKLRILLGRHYKLTLELARWQRIKENPNEQWRGSKIDERLDEYKTKLAAIESDIRSEMRARLGMPDSGVLRIAKMAESQLQEAA